MVTHHDGALGGHLRRLVLVLLVWGLASSPPSRPPTPTPSRSTSPASSGSGRSPTPAPAMSRPDRSSCPINRPVQFNVTSEDVTHGFWPAALGVQVDANPNVVTVIHATPDKLGGFTVRCSQLCGLYHSFMYASGSVVTPQRFAVWLHRQGVPAVQAAARGRDGIEGDGIERPIESDGIEMSRTSPPSAPGKSAPPDGRGSEGVPT